MPVRHNAAESLWPAPEPLTPAKEPATGNDRGSPPRSTPSRERSRRSEWVRLFDNSLTPMRPRRTIALRDMTQPERYTRRIRRLQRAGVLTLWSGIKTGNTPGWPAGKAFEYLVLRAFELEKAVVRYPYDVRLPNVINEQIDGVIYMPGIVAIIESKDRGAMNIEPVAKLRNQLHRRPAGAIGVFFSRGGFTVPTLVAALGAADDSAVEWGRDRTGADEEENARRLDRQVS